MPKEHVIPRDTVCEIIPRRGVLFPTRPGIFQIPGLQVMQLDMKTQRRMLDAIGETQLEVQGQHLRFGPV